ncbi:MAG: vWA domain-containing protein, partial [Actinomycetota bacterium]
AGVPVAVSENLDTLRALEHIPLAARESVRAALATTMIKSEAHRPAFDILFDIYLGAGPADTTDEETRREVRDDPEDFREQLMNALMSGDGAAIRMLAERAVMTFGRVEDSPSGSLYFQYPVFRAVDLDALMARMMDEPGMSEMERRLRRGEFDERVKLFRRVVAREVNRRVAERRGPETVIRTAVRPLPETLDFSTATAAEIAQLRRAIRPLARRLATRVAIKRRRSSRGTIDIRRTIRHSLSTGGAPFELEFRHRPPHRPELFVLCDISSSVASFSRFSLMLVHALAAQFTRVRSFAFIDTIDEVTRSFEHEDFVRAVDRMNKEAEVVWIDGHSNYGASLEKFAETYGKDLNAKSTLLVLGDARTNFRPPKSWALKGLRDRAHRTYWLNPEAETYWDTGDSVASEYAACVDEMVEVRNLKQLESFIETVI